MAVAIPTITRAVLSADLQMALNWLITQINTQNVSGTTPSTFPP
jgi:hypothetical protein